MTNSSNYTVVFVTVSSPTEGEAIASALIEANLAACVSLTPIHSIYRWEGKINSEPEWQLMIKTKLDKFSLLSAKIKALHSYDVPEIIALPIIAGSQTYLNWIDTEINN